MRMSKSVKCHTLSFRTSQAGNHSTDPSEKTLSGKRKFNLTGVWKEKCAHSLPHPTSDTADTADTARNWCWEYMKHNGCYATHGYSSWFEDQLKLSQLSQAPPPFDPALRLEGLEEASLCEVLDFGRDWILGIPWSRARNFGYVGRESWVMWTRNDILMTQWSVRLVRPILGGPL